MRTSGVLLPLVALSVCFYEALSQQSQPGNPVITSNKGQTVLEGDLVTLTCESRGGNPAAEVEWRRNDLEVVNNIYSVTLVAGIYVSTNTYTFTATNNDDNVIYVCRAKNVISEDKVAIWPLQVNTIPSDPQITGPSEVVSGQSYTWTCTSAGGRPQATLNFRLNGVSLATFSNLTSAVDNEGKFLMTRTLRYTPTGADHNGILRCELEHATLPTKKTVDINLTIIFAPEFDVSPGSYEANIGQDATLDCIVTGNPVPDTFSWSFEGTVISLPDSHYQDGTLLSTSLTILNVQLSDLGSYICSASNSVGSRTSSPITLAVYYAPIITLPADGVGTLNGDIVLSCLVDASPDVSAVTWFSVNGATVTPIDPSTSAGHYSGSTVQEPSLTIHSLLKSDDGDYRCTATNIVGNGVSNNDLTLVVNYSPENIQLTSNSFSLTEGDNVTVTCSAVGMPTPSFQWAFGGMTIQSGATLRINPVGPVHHGTFVCIAQNEAGSSTADVVMDVRYFPRPCAVNCPTYELEAELNTPFMLDCVTNSNPSPSSYVWMFQGETLPETGKTLTITPTDESQAGQYQCVAFNSLGQSDPIEFTVTLPHSSTTDSTPFSTSSDYSSSTDNTVTSASADTSTGTDSSAGTGSPALSTNNSSALASTTTSFDSPTNISANTVVVTNTPTDSNVTDSTDTLNTSESTANFTTDNVTDDSNSTSVYTAPVITSPVSTQASPTTTAPVVMTTTAQITTPGVKIGATAVGCNGLCAWEIALIVIGVLLIVLLVTVIFVCLYLNGKLPCKPKSRRVKPLPDANRPTPQPIYNNIRAHPDKLGTEMEPAVSRKDVNVEPKRGIVRPLPPQPPVIPPFKPKYPESDPNINMEEGRTGGTIISMLDATNGNAKGHPLPPLLGQGPQPMTDPKTAETNENEPKEHKKKRRRKKKKHRETNEEISGEQPSESTGNESKLIGDPASIEV